MNKRISEKYVVGIDLGTSSAKTAVFNMEGEMVGCTKCGYPTHSPKPGIVLQKEEEVLDAIYSSCKQTLEQIKIPTEQIASVSFSTNVGGNLFVDDDNHVIGDIITWQDTRAKQVLPKLLTSFPFFYRISNLQFYPYIGVPGRFTWMKKKDPETVRKMKHYCSPIDWVQKEFGATDYFIDTASATCMGLADGTKRVWSQKLMDFFDISEEYLPKILNEAGKQIGTVNAEAAKRSGLPEGTPICLGAHDVMCMCIGSGAVNDGDCAMVVGTIGENSYTYKKPIHTLKQDITSFPRPGQEQWSLNGINTTSASAFQWFSDTLCNAYDGITNPEAPISFHQLDKAASTAPIDCNGILFTAELTECQGAFTGLSFASTKSDMARAVMEAVAFNCRMSTKIERSLPFQPTVIRFSGGAAKSRFWAQMFADVLNKTIVTTECDEVGCLGAAIYGAVGSGLYASVEEATVHMVHEKARYEPIPENVKQYNEVYKAWKKAVKKVMKIK